jgi:hypothetical protein
MLLAQGADSASVLIQYGAVGVLALASMAIARVLFKRFEETLKLEREGRSRAEDEVRTLNALIRDQHVPALQQATAVIAQSLRAARRDGRDHDDAA